MKLIKIEEGGNITVQLTKAELLMLYRAFNFTCPMSLEVFPKLSQQMKEDFRRIIKEVENGQV